MMLGVYGSSPVRERKAADERRARIEAKRAELAARLERLAR